MKRLVGFLGWWLAAGSLPAQEPAQVTIYCTSLRFDAATGGPGQIATLQMTSDPSLSEINGEVGALFDPALPSHGAVFRLEDPTFPDSLAGRIAFDQPQPSDANEDGFDDFFQVMQGVAPTTTRGFFETPVDSGMVTATWSRDAGTINGVCRLELVGDTFGELPAFTHTFQVLEYSGALMYVPNTNGATGTLSLTRTQDPTQTLAGTVSFTRTATNRFNQLMLQPGSLTNAAGQALTYSLAQLDRDQFSKTNYFGFLDFADGDLATGTIDYWDWVLSINDPNDSDGDGIADLSDDLVEVPRPEATLALTRAEGQLLLNIQGGTGQTYEIEHSVSLRPVVWLKTTSVTLTNDSQSIALPPPETQTRFWRARVP